MGAKLGNISKIAWLTNYYILNHSTVFYIFLHEDRIPLDILGDVFTFMEQCIFAPKKGKKEQKLAEQLEKINFFVYCCKLAHLIFLIFHIHLEGIKGAKIYIFQLVIVIQSVS